MRSGRRGSHEGKEAVVFQKERLSMRTGHRHSIFCILPPHVLVEIAKNGTKEQREAAVDALDTDHSIRTGRLTFTLLGGPRGREDVSGAAPKKNRTIYDAKGVQSLPGTMVRHE